jgi:hypothetical protein
MRRPSLAETRDGPARSNAVFPAFREAAEALASIYRRQPPEVVILRASVGSTEAISNQSASSTRQIGDALSFLSRPSADRNSTRGRGRRRDVCPGRSVIRCIRACRESIPSKARRPTHIVPAHQGSAPEMIYLAGGQHPDRQGHDVRLKERTLACAGVFDRHRTRWRP